MTDEATGAEPRILSASFSDPFVLLVRDDESILVLRADESGDLDEVEQGDNLKQKGFRAGSLHEDANDVFRLESDAEIEDDAGNVLMFLLTVAGGLQVCTYPGLVGFDLLSAKLNVTNRPFPDLPPPQSGTTGLQSRWLSLTSTLLDPGFLGPPNASKGGSHRAARDRPRRCFP